jgi:glycosyltransferase involved in cell wall biosynthesis
MKSKILFILHLPPPIHGAAMMGKYIQESKLIDSSFDCYCINLATASNLSDIGRISSKKILKYLLLIKQIFHIVRHIPPKLVYITPNAGGSAFYKDFVVVQMLKSMGCKVVVHYHNKGVSSYQDKWFYNFLYKRFFKNLRVILLAEVLYKDMAKYVKRENVYICPNGIPNSYKEGLEARRNNKVPDLLFLSNLLISKGVFVLLDALKILKERGYTFVCQFVGGETAEINAMQFAKEIEKRKLNDIVSYVGRKVGKEKDSFFRQADIFVFPTYYYNECFPLVILEAMEYKLPIISTNEGGIPDIVKDGENGLICEKQNPDSLADCIAKLLDDEELRIKMGNAGYERLCREYTLQRFEHRMLEILSQNLLQQEKEN